MSELKSKIQSKLVESMKAREQHTVTTLRGLMAAIKQVEVDSRKELADGDVLAIVQKEVKKRREALTYAENQNRSDLVAENSKEIEILSQFLGEQMNEEQLKSEISRLIAQGAGSLGAVMGELNKLHKGKFDGRTASEIAKSMLAA